MIFRTIVLTITLALAGCGGRSDVSARSSYSWSPEGTRIAYEMLQRLGFRVDRLTDEVSALPAADVLFVIEPSIPPTPAELDAIERWVASGGRLVVASSGPTEFHKRLAGKASFVEPGPFTNRAIADGENAVTVAQYARHAARPGGAIVFDEVHHGVVAQRGLIGYIARRGLAPALLQGAAAFLVLALALGGRRARAPRAEEDAPPESREHVRALAEIYAKAKLRRHCAERLEHGLKRDIEAALGPAAAMRAEDVLRERGVRAFRGLDAIARRRARFEAAGDEPAEHELLAFAREVGKFEGDVREALGKRFGEI